MIWTTAGGWAASRGRWWVSSGTTPSRRCSPGGGNNDGPAAVAELVDGRPPQHRPDCDGRHSGRGGLRAAWALFWHSPSSRGRAILSAEIGRASCRERVCPYV